MDTIISLQNVLDSDLNYQIDVISSSKSDNTQQEQIDAEIARSKEALNKLNENILVLTNNADTGDYMLATSSGILSGIIDSLLVGTLSLENANTWGNQEINAFVLKIAQSQGFSGNDLSKADKFLEDKFPLVADKVTNSFGGGLQHHLRDFSHHPTPLGLFFSLLSQFTNKVYGTDVTGAFTIADIPDVGMGLIGKSLPEKITLGVINWFFHMVSDMAGSSSSIYKGKLGTGLPGPLVSFLKEISALPFFKKTNEKNYKEFSVFVSKLFNGTLLGQHDEEGKILEPLKFDLRTEIGVLHESGKQFLPVLINECIVRGFYFIRRICAEIKAKHIVSISDLRQINLKAVLPFKNATITRMLTVSSGIFTAIDIGDAAVHAASNPSIRDPSVGPAPVFFVNMALRINFVGIGRFVFALGAEAGTSIHRHRAINERMQLCTKLISLTNTKVSYKQGEMWKSAEDAGAAVREAYKSAQEAVAYYNSAMSENEKDLDKIGSDRFGIHANNPSLIGDITDILEWG